METVTLLDGRYRLDEKVGSGGMSTVYFAFDLTLERPVALKLLHREIASDSDQLERFRREARAVAKLSHPHIVTVIDAGEDGGSPYIVFEFVEGETLKQRIQRCGRLPIAEAVAYAIEIARALAAAHAQGVIHRDVKPQNIMIDPEGSAKVTDFGIALTQESASLTASGHVIGTTDYVSPEQALGQEVGPQSDIYSLGVVLFEMLTGVVPFKGENQVAVAMKHVREALPDVRSLRPEVSAALAATLDRATAKNPALRYMNITELTAELEDILALETSRSGRVTGEVTTVLKTLPAQKQRRVALSLRHPASAVLAGLAIVGVAIGLALLLASSVQRGTGGSAGVSGAGLTQVSLGQTAAVDFDPLGGDGEHPEEANFLLDRDPNTTWSTERYGTGLLGKDGVGIYLDAAPGIAARALDVRTETPGFTAEVFAARNGPPETAPPSNDWTKVAGSELVKRQMKIELDTAGQRFSYYLLWITVLPSDAEQVAISELYLLTD